MFYSRGSDKSTNVRHFDDANETAQMVHAQSVFHVRSAFTDGRVRPSRHDPAAASQRSRLPDRLP